MFKIGKRVKWEDIKVGDIFIEDVWGYDVFEKRSKISGRFIASTTGFDYSGVGGFHLGNIVVNIDDCKWNDSCGLYYELSKPIQNLFKKG